MTDQKCEYTLLSHYTTMPSQKFKAGHKKNTCNSNKTLNLSKEKQFFTSHLGSWLYPQPFNNMKTNTFLIKALYTVDTMLQEKGKQALKTF